MPKDDQTKRMKLEEFARKFREALGRDMTPDERQWFQLSRMVESGPEEEETEEGDGATLRS